MPTAGPPRSGTISVMPTGRTIDAPLIRGSLSLEHHRPARESRLVARSDGPPAAGRRGVRTSYRRDRTRCCEVKTHLRCRIYTTKDHRSACEYHLPDEKVREGPGAAGYRDGSIRHYP